MAAEKQISYNKEFDSKFQYNKKDLGVTYAKEGSVFKIWSPLSDEVTLYLYENGEAKQFAAYQMTCLSIAPCCQAGTLSWK